MIVDDSFDDELKETEDDENWSVARLSAQLL